MFFKIAYIYHCDKPHRWLDLGDPDLIFKGQSLVSRISFEPVDWIFFSNLNQYIIVASL